jgi:hypothetical protein
MWVKENGAKEKAASATRSVELARASQLDGTARLECVQPRTLGFIVPSRSREREYQVIAGYDWAVWCEQCLAAKHNRPCCHAGAVYHALRQLTKACASYADNTDVPSARAGPRDDAWCWWANGGKW